VPGPDLPTWADKLIVASVNPTDNLYMTPSRDVFRNQPYGINFYRKILNSRLLYVLQSATALSTAHPVHTAHPLSVLACSYELEETALKCAGNVALSDLEFSSSPVRHVYVEWGRLQHFLPNCAG